MATFDLEAFVAEPTHVALELCRKVDLLEIARHYAIPVSPALRVGELREAILAELVANGVVVLPVSSDPVAGAAVGDAVVSPVRPGVERVEQPQLGSPAALFEEAEEKSPGLGLRSPRDARVDVRIARLKHEREKEEREFHLKREIELRRIEFPIDGVEFIMGNDLAGGKVYPSPEVVTRPILSSDVDELAEKHPDVFSVSVLTRAQSKMAREQMDCSQLVLVLKLGDLAVETSAFGLRDSTRPRADPRSVRNPQRSFSVTDRGQRSRK
uniref:Uncharacterized protein n=1 Tax=Knipowitschia caucasica TaxID=637954 RepID=A0AAV2K407_KNICA